MTTTGAIRLVGATTALLALAACGTDTTTATNSSSGGATQAPVATTTLAAATVSGHGVVLVAGFNGMTVYQFDGDVAGSGTSACSGGCATTWPPFTITSGTSPTAAAGITGQLGTLTRADGKGIQVTYNGKPLHFYSGDTKPGDANGNYPGWSSVAAGSSGAATSTPTPAGTHTPYGY